MSDVLRITIFAMGSLFVVLVFYLLITKKINERASLPWITTCIVIMALAVIPSILRLLASLLRIEYPPALLFLIANFVLFLLLLYQSVQISALQAKCRELAQNLSILNSTGTDIARPSKGKKSAVITEPFNFKKENKINIPL